MVRRSQSIGLPTDRPPADGHQPGHFGPRPSHHPPISVTSLPLAKPDTPFQI